MESPKASGMKVIPSIVLDPSLAVDDQKEREQVIQQQKMAPSTTIESRDVAGSRRTLHNSIKSFVRKTSSVYSTAFFMPLKELPSNIVRARRILKSYLFIGFMTFCTICLIFGIDLLILAALSSGSDLMGPNIFIVILLLVYCTEFLIFAYGRPPENFGSRLKWYILLLLTLVAEIVRLNHGYLRAPYSLLLARGLRFVWVSNLLYTEYQVLDRNHWIPLEEQKIWARSRMLKRKQDILGHTAANFVGRTTIDMNPQSSQANSSNAYPIEFKEDLTDLELLARANSYDTNTLTSSLGKGTVARALFVVLMVLVVNLHLDSRAPYPNKINRLQVLEKFRSRLLSDGKDPRHDDAFQAALKQIQRTDPKLVHLQLGENVLIDHEDAHKLAPIWLERECPLSSATYFRDPVSKCPQETSFGLVDVRAARKADLIKTLYLNLVVTVMLCMCTVIFHRDVKTLAFRITNPLAQLSAEMEYVAWMDLRDKHDTEVMEGAVYEVQLLQNSFVYMKVCHASSAGELLLVVRQILSTGQIARPHVTWKSCSVLLVDVSEFSSLCESMDGSVFVQLLNEYFDVLSGIVEANHGVLLDYVGDAILAIWNAPFDDRYHAYHAVSAATQMQLRLMNDIYPKWKEKGFADLHLRVGVHTAEMFVGNMGTASRMKYGILGAAVDALSEITEWNSRLGTSILISHPVFLQPRTIETFLTRPVHVIRESRCSKTLMKLHAVMGTRQQYQQQQAEAAAQAAAQAEAERQNTLGRKSSFASFFGNTSASDNSMCQTTDSNKSEGSFGQRTASGQKINVKMEVVSLDPNIPADLVLTVSALHSEAFSSYIHSKFENCVNLCERVLGMVEEDMPSQILHQNALSRLRGKDGSPQT